MEDSVMDTMYETPSDESIIECTINEDVINGLDEPELKYASKVKRKPENKKKTKKSA